MQKILIIYTNYGNGHYKAALAIKEHLEKKYPNKEIYLMDPLSYGRPIINYLFANVGKVLATKLRGLRKFIYDKKMYKNYFKKSWFFDFCIKLFFTNKVKQEILRINPDIIISTQVGPTGIIADNRSLFKAKLISVLTDYGIHRMFTVGHEYIDLFCVPTEEIKKQMVNIGINSKKIEVTGIPVGLDFLDNKKINKNSIIKDFDIPRNLPIYLFVCGGGNGYSNALSYFESLLKSQNEFAYIFIAGKNESLYNKAIQIGNASAKFGITLKYVENMEELIRVSDLVFGKPGGLITSETLSIGKPFIAANPIPGQESFNGTFIDKNGFGRLINNQKDFNKLLKEIENDEKLLSSWKNNISKHFYKFNFINIDKIKKSN